MRILILLLALVGVGCASSTKQTDAYLEREKGRASVARSMEIPEVPFVNQKDGHCGPATLTMALNWAGKGVSVEELAPQVFIPGMRGSLQSDMVTAARRQGFVAVPVRGLEALIRELDAGHPVIVFENLAFDWWPQWHYALVFGYDLGREEVLMHSGPEARKRWDLRVFERSWMRGDYWGLVVLPPGRLSASAGEMENAAAASALESLGFSDGAGLAYSAVLERWPQSLVARMGLANIEFAKGNPRGAALQLKAVVLDHPESAMAWHNLAIAQGGSGDGRNAARSAKKAMGLVPAAERADYLERLRPWL